MIKLVIFDLDGVLVDAREIHYEALNLALEEINPKYVIGREEHLSTYDGRPTTAKLNLLHEKKGLPIECFDRVWKLKQQKTQEVIKKLGFDEQKISLLSKLEEKGYKLYCASNSIRKSIRTMLYQRGLISHIDYIISNEDVRNPKPHPEVYLRCMLHAGVSPQETLIVEDSNIGRKAAIESGAHLAAVRNPEDVTFEYIQSCIEKAEHKHKQLSQSILWDGGNMNIVIPMAGAGSRFEKAGYTFPKPLIDVGGKPMIQVVVENLNMAGEYIFIVQKEHRQKYALDYLLKNISRGTCKIVEVDGITEGAACTVLLTEKYIDNNKPLFLANSDQYALWDSNAFMYSMVGDQIDGGILTFPNFHPKWSYARLGEDGFVAEVAEKKPISDLATVGYYYWSKGSDFVKYAKQMIDKNIRTNNEFYVAPVFNEAIADGKKIKNFHLNENSMFGLGTPEDLQVFLKRFE